MISAPSTTTSNPPNPPQYGTSGQTGKSERQRQLADSNTGWGATILGQGNPSNTGQKTLLGQ